MEFYESMEMDPNKVAEPKDILTKLLVERRRLIMGHYGNPKTDKKILDESLLPSHYAISLSSITPKLLDPTIVLKCP